MSLGHGYFAYAQGMVLVNAYHLARMQILVYLQIRQRLFVKHYFLMPGGRDTLVPCNCAVIRYGR